MQDFRQEDDDTSSIFFVDETKGLKQFRVWDSVLQNNPVNEQDSNSFFQDKYREIILDTLQCVNIDPQFPKNTISNVSLL